MRVAVEGEGKDRFIEEARRRLGLRDVEFCGGQDSPDALLLLGSGAEAACAAEVAVLPGDAAPVKARCAVSYGMSPKDTVTVSSVGDRQLLLSVQREFETLGGRRVLIQEFPLDWEMSPHSALPIAALGLITGELREAAYAAP